MEFGDYEAGGTGEEEGETTAVLTFYGGGLGVVCVEVVFFGCGGEAGGGVRGVGVRGGGSEVSRASRLHRICSLGLVGVGEGNEGFGIYGFECDCTAL